MIAKRALNSVFVFGTISRAKSAEGSKSCQHHGLCGILHFDDFDVQFVNYILLVYQTDSKSLASTVGDAFRVRLFFLFFLTQFFGWITRA
jgi:hypothetical protein